MTDRGVAGAGQGLYGSMLGSVHMGQQQPGSAAHMASQLQLTASQLAAPHDPAVHNPLACRQLMLQASTCCVTADIRCLHVWNMPWLERYICLRTCSYCTVSCFNKCF